MIIERIKRHNIINGFWFSTIEFSGVAVLVAAFAVYAWLQGKWQIGVIGVGIACNCLPVVIEGVLSIRGREEQIGFIAWLRKDTRDSIARRYPETSLDTVVIVLTTVLPFVALCLWFADVFKRKTV